MPIEGLFAFVDLSSKTVIEVVDMGVVNPAPKDPWGYTAKEVKDRFGSLCGPTVHHTLMPSCLLGITQWKILLSNGIFSASTTPSTSDPASSLAKSW
jgi:hypothetical protein